MYGLEKFHQYTYGRKVIVQSDHKPLEVNVKKAPKRLQRVLLRVQLYDVTIVYRKGKRMELADTLSRAHGLAEEPTTLERLVETVNMTEYLSLSAARVDDIKVQTDN